MTVNVLIANPVPYLIGAVEDHAPLYLGVIGAETTSQGRACAPRRGCLDGAVAPVPYLFPLVAFRNPRGMPPWRRVLFGACPAIEDGTCLPHGVLGADGCGNGSRSL